MTGHNSLFLIELRRRAPLVGIDETKLDELSSKGFPLVVDVLVDVVCFALGRVSSGRTRTLDRLDDDGALMID